MGTKMAMRMTPTQSKTKKRRIPTRTMVLSQGIARKAVMMKIKISLRRKKVMKTRRPKKTVPRCEGACASKGSEKVK